MTIQIKKTSINISMLFFSVALLASIFDRTNITIYALISAAIHELFHLIFMVIFRYNIKDISIKPFGISITKDEYSSRRDEFIVISAGPFANILLALFLFSSDNNLYLFGMTNLVLAIFNLIPVGVLDGGRLLLLLLSYMDNPYKERKIFDIVSSVIVVLLSGYAMVLCVVYQNNFSIMITVLYLVSLIIFKDNKNKKPRVR